jgi:hypothetical protein
MSQPFTVDVPHNLGAAEARKRVQANLHKLAGKLPAGATVTPAWEGERLKLELAMLSQQVGAWLDIFDNSVRITVNLPPALAFFRQAIEAGLRKSGTALLADRSEP